MSVDAERWPMGLNSLPTALSVPLEIGIAVWMLYGLIGWSIFVGLGAVIITLPLHAKISAFLTAIRAAKMKKMDIRLRIMNEVLGGMKIVRLYNWEDSFNKKVAVVRKDELKLIKRFGSVFAVVSVVFMSTPLVITLVSLAVYATHGGPDGSPGDINPQTIFVSISLFGLLSRPISALSNTISQVTSIMVATTRIQKFLLAEELDESIIVREAETGQDDGCPVVEINDGVFAWCPEHAPIESEKQKRIREKEEARKQKEAVVKSKKSGNPIPPKKEDEKIDYSPTLTNINLS
ncbi:Canalicular multispecific organic anion transporter 2, partial [Entomortierella beljakovae]